MSKYMKRVRGSWHSWFYLLTVKAKHLIVSDISSLMYTVQPEKCLEEMKGCQGDIKKIKIYICWPANPNPQVPWLQWANHLPLLVFYHTFPWNERLQVLPGAQREGCGETAGGRGTLGYAGDPKRPRQFPLLSGKERKNAVEWFSW